MEADNTFLNILCRPEYETEGYKEVLITVHGKQYLVKIPIKNVQSYLTAHNKSDIELSIVQKRNLSKET
jgi:hypothetical protein